MVQTRALVAARLLTLDLFKVEQRRGLKNLVKSLFGQKNEDISRFGNYEIVRPGLVSPVRRVPQHIEPPPYAMCGIPPPSPPGIEIRTSEELDGMRKAGELARKILDKVGSLISVSLIILPTD
jgi:methionyl aminopeptidase